MLNFQNILLVVVLLFVASISCSSVLLEKSENDVPFDWTGYCKELYYSRRYHHNSNIATKHKMIRTNITEMKPINFSTNFHIYPSIYPNEEINWSIYLMRNLRMATFIEGPCILCNNVTSELNPWNVIMNKPLQQFNDLSRSDLVYTNSEVPILNSDVIGLHTSIPLEGIYIENASMYTIDGNISILTGNYGNSVKNDFTLNLNNNLLIYIPWRVFENITEIVLSLQHNKYTDLGYSLCGPKFRLIYLQDNLITSLDIDCQIYVRYLNISGNAIQKFYPKSLEQYPDIKFLDVSRNQINELIILEETHVMVDTLESLSLNNNKLKVIPRRIFRCFPALLHLNLQNNEISSLDPEALKDLRYLLQLDLSSNDISDIPYGFFRDCSSLRELTLADNNIKTLTIKTFSGLHDLKVLNISHNYLSHFLATDILVIHALRGLDVSNNLIRKLDMHELVDKHGLRHVSYANNLWSCVDLVQMLKASKKLYNNEQGHFHDLSNINGIPCSSRDITWPTDVTFDDFLNQVSKEQDFEIAMAQLNAIADETGNGLVSSDNRAVEKLLAVILIVLIIDFVIKWASKVYKCRQSIFNRYALLKSKSQQSVSTAIV